MSIEKKMSENFAYESVRSKEFKIYVPKDCIDRDNGRFKTQKIRALLMQEIKPSVDWESPKQRMPIKLDVKVYYPVPHKQPLWFHNAARRSLVPCVTEYGTEFVTQYVVPSLMHSLLIINYQQIHAVNYESTYSDRPRILINIEKMYQSVGLVREKTGKRKAKNEPR